MLYEVCIIIEPKPYLNDPEGETILKDLILKGGYNMVKSVRSAKMLKLVLEANDAKDAEDLVRRVCDELRIYNPLVSNLAILSITKL